MSGSSTPGGQLVYVWTKGAHRVVAGVCIAVFGVTSRVWDHTVTYAQQTTHSCLSRQCGSAHTRSSTNTTSLATPIDTHPLSEQSLHGSQLVASNARSRDQLLCYPFCSLSLQATHMHRLLSRAPWPDKQGDQHTKRPSLDHTSGSADPAPRTRRRCVCETERGPAWLGTAW